ncbi:MAG: glycosyltransferase family 2 protein, partial [Puniceicoccales bacterium]
MSNESIPTSPLPAEFAFGPRMRLQDMPGLRAERWNLLPGDSMGADQLESSLAWQEGIYPEWFGSPCLEIRWSPNLTNPARAAKVLGSIAAQSVTRFQLQVLIADDEASQKYSEFGRFVEKNEALSLSELVEAMNLSSRTQVVVGSLPEESAAEWIFVLSPEDCLHPMALFCLLKSARADSPDVVCFFETLTDEATGGPHAVHMIRGVSLYSILGDAGVSRSLLFSAEAARMLGLNQGGEVRSAGEDDFPEWRWMLVAGRIGMRVHRLSLALTAIEATRGHPVSHGRGAKGVTSTIKQFAKVKEIDLRNWRFDEVRGSGAPVPVPSSLAIAAIIPFRDQEELTAATFRSLANQSVAKRVRLVAVDNGSAPEVA